MTITKRSALTGVEHTLEVPIAESAYKAWQHSNTPIQIAFSNLNADQREFLITGATPEEWEEAFGEEDAT